LRAGVTCTLLTHAHSQVWLALNNLLVDPQCRQKYDLDSYRTAAVLKIRRLMNEILFDQLPVLKDLVRILDEVQMGLHASDASSTAPILEQVQFPDSCC
jgi:zinc finger MYND domain-containing protein 10